MSFHLSIGSDYIRRDRTCPGGIMGIYLNPGADAFQIALRSRIYVDKTGMIHELNSVLGTEQRYVCISRPRRFGKSMAANMISAYYDRTTDGKVFDGLKISRTDMSQQGKYNVLRINMQEFLSESASVTEMISFFNESLLYEILEEYPDFLYFRKDNLRIVMSTVFSRTNIPFIVIIDEWDCIFREYPDDREAQKEYLDFLRAWLKDKSYIALAYMTGILPIKKYGSHSALNMFYEYSMQNPGEYAQYVGFTEEEVKALCDRYHVSFEECSSWYDGYYFRRCGHVYNPRSIVSAMLSGVFDDYWNKTETYEALKIYIDMNFDGLKDSIIEMMAGARISIDTSGFENDMTTFSRKDDVLTLLIHLGYLGYDFDTGIVFIPNREILSEFVTATTISQWDEIIRSVNDSGNLLKATWNGDEKRVASGIEKAHLETSHLQYNDENALSYTISLAYYAARQYYTIIRELPAGKGFADLAFIPRRKYALEKPAMIVELKWDKSARSAIRQIHEKEYAGVLKDYHGNIILAGISYSKRTRKHTCIIERI